MKSARHTSTTSKANRQNITDVSDSGDLILDVQIPPADEHILYQVSTDILRGTSPYFRNILDPDKFSEGAHVRKAQAKLRERYTSLKDVPAMELPRISVVGVGQLGRRARHEEMMTSFLRILCGTSVDGHPSSPSWLADIVTIADRFDSLEKVKEFVMQHHRLYGIFATKGLNSTFKEELIRQIIYSGALLGVPQWVASCSARLANHGSKRWSTVEEEEDDGDQARWWTLPGGLEGAFNL